MDDSKTFREELAIQYPTLGRPLWEPDPGGLYNAVQVGDVGFIHQGYFTCLFNALPPGDDPAESDPFPQYLQRLQPRTADHIRTTRSRHYGEDICSMTVSHEPDTHALGPDDVTFSCSGRRGALLYFPFPTERQDTIALGDFGKWMVKNIHACMSFAEERGLGVSRMEDIILVTGRHLAKSWVRAVFSERQEGAQVSFAVQTSGDSVVHFEKRNVSGARLKFGPNGEDPLPENQCIFVRGYRVFRFLNIWPRLRGMAGPAPDLDDSEPEPESDTHLQLIGVPPDDDYDDPLHTLLEYVAEQAPTCDTVLVHDDDLKWIEGVIPPFENLQPDGLMAFFRDNAPTIRQFQCEYFPGNESESEAEVAVATVATLSRDVFDAPCDEGGTFRSVSTPETTLTRRANERPIFAAGLGKRPTPNDAEDQFKMQASTQRQSDVDASSLMEIEANGYGSHKLNGYKSRHGEDTSRMAIMASASSMASTSSLNTTHLLHGRPQKIPPDPDPEAVSRSILLDGAEQVFSYGGTSQYIKDGTGTSACGLAALNFARIVFSMEQGGLQDIALVQTVLARECAEETIAICALWSGNLHLEVEDICRVPLFEKTLKLKTTSYGLPGVFEFKSLLTELSNLDSSAVAIITRPPEIIACLKLRLTNRNVFIIFDSHPRPSYPDSAGMIVSSSIEGTARRLTELFATADLPDSLLQWQAQLLSHYSGHVFVPHGVETSTPISWKAVLESLAQLSMQVEISELRSQNEFLKSEQQRLESEDKEAEVRSRRQESLIQQKHGSSSGPLKHFDNPSEPPRHFDHPLGPRRQSPSSARHSPCDSSRPSSKASSSAVNPLDSDSPLAGTSLDRSLGNPGSPPTSPSNRDDNIPYAMPLQHEFSNEDRALSAHFAELVKSTQRLFVCGVCLEEMPNLSIARLDPCGHTFCRECLRGYVSARLDGHRFPILCPTCTASKKKGVTGEVSRLLALDLGLTDKQHSIWIEMEMAAHSVLLHCRKCQRSMFVARDEHEEVNIVICPLPDCNHAWCKQCQKSIDFSGPKHSCNGSSELDHLMKQQGWKYCPTCKTPIQKISGCNHISCMTPACNTHFCYDCGKLIARSALGGEIKEATSAHFGRNCLLFKDVVD